MTTFVICLRLVPPELDGAWMEIKGGSVPVAFFDGHGVKTMMKPTGSVEWDGDRPAEVWVPEARLAEWKAAHDDEPEP